MCFRSTARRASPSALVVSETESSLPLSLRIVALFSIFSFTNFVHPFHSPDASAASPANGSIGGAAAGAAAAEDAAASTAAVQQQQAQQQPQTSEEWVEALVATMSQAKDLPDARVRAAQALQAFEQAAVSAAQVIMYLFCNLLPFVVLKRV